MNVRIETGHHVDELQNWFEEFWNDAEEINEESSPDTIESWDSLRHMNIVIALEEEFNVQFDTEARPVGQVQPPISYIEWMINDGA